MKERLVIKGIEPSKEGLKRNPITNSRLDQSKMLNEKIFFIFPTFPGLPGEIEVSIVLLISLLTYTVAMIELIRQI